jgi:hypothetical protein
MINSEGQLYTIEGFAAALIMIITAFLVVNATSIYTAGDTHINDMQLEALGADALKMMDVAPNDSAKTPLQEIIENATVDGARFNTTFSYIINNGTFQNPNTIQYRATFTCRNIGMSMPVNTISSYPIFSTRNLTGGEHPVRATKWVIVNKNVCDSGVLQNRAVLVEVLLWRD